MTRTDVAQSQARLAQARTQLVQAQGLLSAAVQAYQRLVGYPPTDLQPPQTAEGLPTELQTALDVAGQESPVLRGAEAFAEQADANVESPHRRGAFASRSKPALRSRVTSNPAIMRAKAIPSALRFSVPLFQGGAIRSRTRQQRSLRSAANLELAAAQRSVQESVTVSWTTLASARAAVVSAREQVEASELAYEGVRLEQETGLRSTVEVLDQEQDLLIARLALAQAERDLVVAERQILAAMGSLEPPEGAETRPGN
ncbi:MAG: TolC family protein [Terricaulis sp.]